MPASPITRRLVLAAACFASAAIVLAAIPVAFGRPLREIRVRWTAMSPDARHGFERQFSLTESRRVDAQTWEYVPRDTTPAMLRSIAGSDVVAATDGIDRVAFRMAPRGPLTERRGGWFPGHQALARMAKLAAYLLALLGIAVAASTRITAADMIRVRAYAARVRADPALLRDAALRGIPVIPAEAAGVFRLVFITLVLLIVARDPGDIGRAASVAALQPLRGLQLVIVPWLAAHPSLEPLLYRLLLVSGALAAVGVLTRTSFAVFVATFTVWASVFTVTTGHHAIAALHMTLIGLLAAPWGDAVSVDALWRRRGRSIPARSQRYGFVVWLPGFVFGVAFLAAAWSKVQNGPGWILNGTVRYHFVTDLPHALVPWGPWLTRNHVAAVLVSAAAVLAESTVIIASFTRSSRLRLLLGGAATAMLVGFALFQGLVWRGWWLLLLSFLPWERLRAGSAAAPALRRSTASWMQTAMVAALFVQQGIVSARHLEVPPMASAYDMYSATYDSDYDYEQSTNLQYQLLVRDGSGDHEIAGCVVDDRVAARLRESARLGDVSPAIVRSVCRSAPAPARVVLRGDRHVYDWDHARFMWRRGVDVIGPLGVARPE